MTSEEKTNLDKQIIASKKVISEFSGKEYTEEFTELDKYEVTQSARRYKLNGWSYKSFLDDIDYTIIKYWRDYADDIYKSVNAKPEVGMGATLVLWSDRYACTITRVISDEEIAVRRNYVECTDYYAGDYNILDELDTRREEEIFTLRRGGGWYYKGEPKKRDSVILVLGSRHHYVDPSF